LLASSSRLFSHRTLAFLEFRHKGKAASHECTHRLFIFHRQSCSRLERFVALLEAFPSSHLRLACRLVERTSQYVAGSRLAKTRPRERSQLHSMGICTRFYVRQLKFVQLQHANPDSMPVWRALYTSCSPVSPSSRIVRVFARPASSSLLRVREVLLPEQSVGWHILFRDG
jgi:hypothetical protein